MEYSESRVFSDMIDFISRLLVVDPEKRMSAREALDHTWLNERPYNPQWNIIQNYACMKAYQILPGTVENISKSYHKFRTMIN